MKRPLSVFGFTMLGSLFLLCTVDSAFVTVSVCGFFAFLGSVLAVLRKKSKSSLLFTFCLAVAFSCAFLMFFQLINYYPAVNVIGENKQITAEILQPPSRDYKRYHVLAKMKLDNSAKNTKIRLSFAVSTKYDDQLQDVIESLEVGDTVSFSGNIYKLGQTNSDAENNFKSKNVFIGAYPKGKVILQKAQRRSLSCFLIMQRQKIINKLLRSFDGNTSGVGIALLLGDKSYLDASIYNCFKKSGAAHIMAVSGLHLSVWISLASALVSYFKFNKRKVSGILILFVIFSMSITLFSASIARAGIMLILYLLGNMTRNRADSLNSLGFASVVILLNNPYASLNVGFLLSFLSTLAIISLAPNYLSLVETLLDRKINSSFLNKTLSSVLFSILISFFTLIFTAPVSALYFGNISLVSALTNLLLLPIVSPLLISFGIFSILPSVPLLTPVLKAFTYFLSCICIKITEFFSSFQFSSIVIERNVIPVILIFSVFSAFLLIILSKRKSFLISAMSLFLSFLMLSNCILFNEYYITQNVIIKVYNVSDGLCVGIKVEGIENLIYSQTDEYYTEFLASEIQKIQYAVIDNPENENIKLVSKLSPERIYINSNKELLPINLRGITTEEKNINLVNCKINNTGRVIYVELYGIIIAITNKTVENADVIITDNEETDIMNKTVVLSSSKSASNSFSTADYSNITISVSKKGKISIRGENTWRSLTRSN